MQPYHFTFVMEQTLGHVPFSANLRRVFEKESSIRLTWLPVEYNRQGRLESLPVIRDNWSLRGSYKARRLVNAARRNQGTPDLYFFHTQTISLLSSGWLPGNIPLVISLDATPLNYDRVGIAYGHKPANAHFEKIKLWVNRRALQSATYLVAWSEWAKQSLVNDYGIPAARIEVLPPGTNLDFWQDAAGAIKPSRLDGKVRLLFVGGDFERKGGRLLYEQFRRYFSDSCELHLVTKGQVEPAEGVRVYRNIAPNSPELQALFRQADVFVLPTDGDCLPVAIGEAMAAGLPVISTRVGAIQEAVVQGENGFTIRPGDGEGLAGAIREMVARPDRRERMGQAGRRRAEAGFDAERNGRRLLEICQALAARRPVPALQPAGNRRPEPIVNGKS